MADTSYAHEAAALCQSCGLCCTGHLFEGVSLDASEREEKSSFDDPDAVGDDSALPQPCPHLKCGLCSIYDQRPRRCRDFACITLQKVVSGELSAPQASQRVAEVQKRITSLVPLVRSVTGQDLETVGFRAFIGTLIMVARLKQAEHQTLDVDEQRLLFDSRALLTILDRQFLEIGLVSDLSDLIAAVAD